MHLQLSRLQLSRVLDKPSVLCYTAYVGSMLSSEESMVVTSYFPWQFAMFQARGLYFCRTLDRGVVLSDQLRDDEDEDVVLSSMRPIFATDAVRRADDLPVRLAFLDSLDELAAVFADSTYDVLVLDHVVFDVLRAGRRYCPARGLWLRVAPSGWALVGPPMRAWAALL